MGRIIISENSTIDGVGQDPTGDEGFDRGGWFQRVAEADRAAWAAAEAAEAESAAALLLGRRSYDWFAGRWSVRTGAWADRLRALPKHVVTSRPLDATWANSTVLDGDPIDAITTLKTTVDGDIVVYANHGLIPALFDHGLVDEVRLMVFPFVLGDGPRLFGHTGLAAGPLRLVGTRAVGDGIARLTYRCVR
ncbi:dihydrofolate reductase family protein [Asanoa sp. WMMD1127]|uniref:dihydrofolate reductase family protein n=1 Tax=Asanoa sp. WMMD1127 TaxID=3016107 RepID=UPI00241666BB|nr:dihydrofolate reductase family protein [Asanoa sp. WMMD1127]MDG4825738.1 dihydrofolate reductase family protein [Asanoa sp. WMMD1127]